MVNPFWIRVPLCHPDRLLKRCHRYFDWLFSAPAMLAVVLLGIWALAAVLQDWHRFASSSQGILAPSNWWALGLAWIGLKTVHELSHALVCRKYGGQVREMGIVLILFAPAAYVDVTSAWRFSSKWQRIHTAMAGMFSELAIAAIAALWWANTDSPVLQHVLFNVIFMASLATLLFNANPLMRFDGYYVLADLLEIPNLYTSGALYVRGAAARLFLGAPAPQVSEAGMRALFLKGYGVAAFGWRLLVCASLTIAASVLFHGAGVVIAALGIVMWIGRPACRTIASLVDQHRIRPLTTVRCAVVSLLIATLAIAVARQPWPGARTAPGIVEFTQVAVVRARTPGFVQSIHVQNGQYVESGQLLVELSNRDVETEYRDLQLAVEESTARHNLLLKDQDAAAAQIEFEQRLALQKRLAEKKRQFDALQVRAPLSGRVMLRNPDSRIHTFLDEGGEIMTIGEPQQKELRVSIAQQDAEHFAARLGQPFAVRLPVRGRGVGVLKRVAPRAASEPEHLALTAPYHGPLPVRLVQGPTQGEEKYELTRPRFEGVLILNEQLSRRLRAGEIGGVALRSYDQSVGRVAYQTLNNWIQEKLSLARAVPE